MPSFEVELTDKGRRLVKAWWDGSSEDIAEALEAKPDEST